MTTADPTAERERGPGQPIDPAAIMARFYPVGSRTFDLLLRHGRLVADKALAVLDAAPWLDADRAFVVEAALLHDIGIGRTHCPQLGCAGDLPYVCHGVQGRKQLDRLGLVRHGLVCERHVGAGMRAEEIAASGLPLPQRDMLPLSVEEQLICYADKFYSKSNDGRREKGLDEIVAGLQRWGENFGQRFMALHDLLTICPTSHTKNKEPS